jgi:hypothetical protein
MSKLLITSGCSFSECNLFGLDTWARHLSRKLIKKGYHSHISCGVSSQGNGLISRKPMYEVCKALKTYKPEDILVGIMWSHSNRFDYRCEDSSVLSWIAEDRSDWMSHPRNFNPQSFVDGAPKNWVMGNLHWNRIEFLTYIKYYHSNVGASILSLEHILRTQYFLKLKKIPYFFTDFVDYNIVDQPLLDNPELTYLIDEIDREQYLPVSSEHGWLMENSQHKDEYFKQHTHWDQLGQWVHPATHHHKEFVDRIIYPWLKKKNYV